MTRAEYKYTEGPILKSVWRLAWPAVTSMFFETFLSITDAFWVGKLGAPEMAAVTSSMFPIWTIFSMLTIIPIGVVAIISRAVGAGRTSEVGRTARQSLLFAIWIGIAFSIFGFLIAPALFKLMGTEEIVTRLGVNYLRIFFVGVIFFFINDTFSGIFRAVGDAKAHLIGYSAAIIINIILDPLLIFGVGPFPRWGTSGASVATIIAAGCGTIVFLRMIARGRFPYPIRFRFLEKLDLRLIGSIVRIGFPPAIAGITFSVVYIFINRIVADFGTISIAALMIGNRMESLSYLTCFGFSMAASTLVGQNLGAGNPSRAARSAWAALGISVAATFVISILFLAIPRQLSAFFINDEQVIIIAIDYLRILALSQMFMAAEIVLEGAFAGAGNTIPPMAVSIPGSVARLPLAYYLAFIVGMGINGIWWTLTITTWIKAIIIIYWFWRGRWKKTGLIAT
jgi:putative MATE family efflux protein